MAMEKQKSFSYKNTKFFIFSLTISLSLIFLTFFSIWVFKSDPFFVNQETQKIQFQSTSLNFISKPLNSSKDSNFLTNGKNLSQTQFSKSLNSSKDSIFLLNLDVENGQNLSQTQVNKPLNSSKDSIFLPNGKNLSETQFSKPLNSSKDSIFLTNGKNLSQTQFSKPLNSSKDSIFLPNGKNSSQTQFSKSWNSSKDSIFLLNLDDEKSQNLSQTHLSKPLNSSKDSIFLLNLDGFERKSSVFDDVNSKSRNVNKIEEKKEKVCDITNGKWEFDKRDNSLYNSLTCPFIDEGFDCEGNGRLDKDFMKWKWKTHDCHIPRFNATNMLELIRGKRLVFVGDSINRNQWESMLCLLTSAIKDPKRVFETHGRRITKEKGNYCFKFLDYKCTVEYYVSHFLVHEGKGKIGRKRMQTLRIDTVDRGSSRWKGADILIFNTAHWWSHYKTKSGVNYYQEGDTIIPHLDSSTAFKKSMNTWASWVDKNINPRKTQVIFRSSSPSHFNGGEWNAGGHCKEAFRPLNKTADKNYLPKNIIVEEVLKQMKIPVMLLNVTTLSDYRNDGHPSIYGKKGGNVKGEDCSHWCLPGVPDVWNQILNFHLQSTVNNRYIQ